MGVYVPRDYQDAQINYSTDFIFNNTEINTGLIGAPTGTGKSIVVGGIVDRVSFYYPDARILMLTHVKELVEQNHEKAQAMCPNIEIGLWSAGLRKKQYHYPVVFAGIDTVARSAENLGKRDVIIIDEAHRVSPNPATNYSKVLHFLRSINPHCKTVGLTATPYRMGQGLLTREWRDTQNVTHAAFWNRMLLDMTSPEEFKKFFDQGYLKRLVPKSTQNEIPITGFRLRNNEFVQADIEAVVNNEQKIQAIVDELCENGFDRRSWLVFGSGSVNAKLLHAEIARRGISCAVVTDDTPAAERAAIVAAFKRYEIRCLVNNDIFTTGFDHNGVDLIGVVRVTNSTPLWVQMLGRGTRPVYAEGYDLSTQEGRLAAIFASGVYNCLVLDFANNTERLGAINDPAIPVPPTESKRRTVSESPLKKCDLQDGGCGLFVPASARQCDSCGHIFPMSQDIKDEAGTTALIDEKEHVPDIRKLVVSSVHFAKKQINFGSGGTSTTVVARYHCNERGKFEETLAFNGTASPVKTRKWWDMFGIGDIPQSNEEFLGRQAHGGIRRLNALEIYMNKPRKTKPEIIYYGYDDGTTYRY